MELIPFRNYLLFACSLAKAAQLPHLHSLPAFIRDPRTEGYYAPIQAKRAKPVVGFCGFAAPLGLPWGKYRLQEEIRLILDHFGLLKVFKIDSFHTTRVRVLKHLQRSSRVTAQFIIRGFSAFDSSQGLYTEGKEERTKRLRDQYFNNMMEADYVLCSRGHGNFSFRFYEAMACGRIPVFINTNTALPFDDILPWKRYCVWIDESEISRADKIIADFHDQLTDDEFRQLQLDCRQRWEEYLSPEGYL